MLNRTIIKIIIYTILFIISLSLAFTQGSEPQTTPQKYIYVNKQESAHTINNRAYSYIQDKEFKKASQEFQTLINIYSQKKDYIKNEQLVYAYVNFAWVLHKLGNDTEAKLILERFISLYDTSDNSYIQESVARSKKILSKF